MAIQEMPNIDAETSVLREEVLVGGFEPFWKYWKKNQKIFLRVCLKHSRGNIHEAEDALSGAMIKAAEALPKHIGNIQNLRAWLIRLTNNHCIDIHRKERHIQIDSNEIEEIGNGNRDSLIEKYDPETEIIARLDSEFTNRILEAMPPALRTVFVLRFYDEIPYEEIAKRLNITQACVRKRTQRARELFRERFSNQRSRHDSVSFGSGKSKKDRLRLKFNPVLQERKPE